MWQVYYPDGRCLHSDDARWSEVSHRVQVTASRGSEPLCFDVLNEPATEMAIRWSLHHPWHRLKAPLAEGMQFFHYQRAKVNLMDGIGYNWYEAAGYFFSQGRIVMEVTDTWALTRVEFLPFSFDLPIHHA